MTGDIPLYGDVNFGLILLGAEYIYILIYQELYSNLCVKHLIVSCDERKAHIDVYIYE